MPVPKVKEDVWIPTVCNMCFNGCAIRVHKVDGVVVKIEGNPISPVGEGKVCAKGATGIMQLYDPNRKSKPMKRTNPKKGFDQDPGWVEISWEEAYTIAAEKLKTALENDPKSVMMYSMVANVSTMIWGILIFNYIMGGNFLFSDICGAGIHGISDLLNGTGNSAPDYDYCKYLLQFGTQAGTATRHGFNMTVRRFADARVKGTKLVSVDPHMSTGAEKSDTWLPIRPGTDAALALSIAYVLVHELDLIDRPYLKKYTNGPFLVNVDDQRIRLDDDSKKPFVVDLADGRMKLFDDPSVKDVALEGTYEFDGVTYKTGFQIYAENLKKYTPEIAAEITTIPSAKIREVAKEFGEAANIGGTIMIEGKEYPYRPAAADCFSGVNRHKHGFLNIWAIFSLNTLIGSHNVPGGLLGFAPANQGYPETGLPNWKPSAWPEGNMLESTMMMYALPTSIYRTVREGIKFIPGDLGMMGLQPMNPTDSHFIYPVQMNPKKYHHEKKADVLFVYAGNPVKNWGNHEQMADFMRTFDFVCSIDLYLNETSYFADLYLPEATYLERFDTPPNMSFNHHTIGGLSTPWAFSLRQPVVEARDNAPNYMDVMIELVDRVGYTPQLNTWFNMVYSLKGENALATDKKYQLVDVLDRLYKSWFGPEHDLEWFKKNGVITYPRKPEEVYLYPHMDARIPVYWDFLLEAKDRVSAITTEMDIPWELDDYQAVPDWKPCIDHVVTKRDYDLLPIYYTNAWNVDTWSLENPWINEINENEPYVYNIEINRETAKAKGLKSGDRVVLEAANGFKVDGRLLLVEGVHPEVLAVVAGCWGGTSKYQPVGHKKGVAINNLMEGTSTERLCHVSASFEQCVRVKISKA